MKDAECRGSGVDFFPPHMNDNAAATAVQMCNRCSVQTECARYAIVNDIDFGIWGGLSPRARREIKSSGTQRDRSRETHTFEVYNKYKKAQRNDPVQATSRELLISTATVYHHIRIVKFKAILESLAER